MTWKGILLSSKTLRNFTRHILRKIFNLSMTTKWTKVMMNMTVKKIVKIKKKVRITGSCRQSCLRSATVLPITPCDTVKKQKGKYLKR